MCYNYLPEIVPREKVRHFQIDQPCMLATTPHGRLYALPRKDVLGSHQFRHRIPTSFSNTSEKWQRGRITFSSLAPIKVRNVPSHAMLSDADETKIHQLEMLQLNLRAGLRYALCAKYLLGPSLTWPTIDSFLLCHLPDLVRLHQNAWNIYLPTHINSICLRLSSSLQKITDDVHMTVFYC